jgi:hypothetical protein
MMDIGHWLLILVSDSLTPSLPHLPHLPHPLGNQPRT